MPRSCMPGLSPIRNPPSAIKKMPLYEYRCKSCTHEFEKLVSASAQGTPECPECQSPETSRLLSVFASRAAAPAGGGPTPAPAARCGRGCGCH